MDFFLLSIVSLFAIINPFSTVPAFLSITDGNSFSERVRTARSACILAAGVLAVMALSGRWLFWLLGITLPALQIAGGILLFAIGYEMLRAPDPRPRLNPKDEEAARAKDDVAVTPLGIPLICGPGAISTVIVLETQASGLAQRGVLIVSILLVCFASFLVFRLAARGAGWLTPIILRVLRRLMGLLFAVIAAQFVINGISALPFLAD